jgi:hypothetical protein
VDIRRTCSLCCLGNYGGEFYVTLYLAINIYIYRNLHTQQMSVLVLLCTSYTTCFGPYWWPSSGGFVTKNSNAVTVYVNGYYYCTYNKIIYIYEQQRTI